MKRALLHYYAYPAITLTGITLLLGTILVSNTTSADVVDDVVVTVPISCNITDTLDEAHTATINPGQYQSDIGTTNFKVFCNDNSGYAIYAIGYSNEEYGNTKMLATINNELFPTNDINTGTNTSGANSSWAMKLVPVTTASSGTEQPYTPTIESDTSGSFGDYHVVPSEYTKVVTFTSNTDFTIGSSLQSTYQVYIDGTKPAGTYAGKVKYTLVHPNDAAPLPAGKVGVNFHANGSTFSGGTTENKMVYTASPMYIATTPEIVKSSNVNDDGTKASAYASDTNELIPFTAAGATKLKVVIDYGISSGAGLAIATGNWDGMSIPDTIIAEDSNVTGTETYTFNGDTITFNLANFGGSAPTEGYDYGFYARVYPVYTTKQTGTKESYEFATLAADTGTYATTTDWYGSWYANINGTHYDFLDEAEIENFLENNIAALSGTTVDIYRGLTFAEAYTRAGKVQDSGYYKQQELTKSICNTIAVTQNQTLKDTRDSNTYLVGKLKDGNCWMLDNLALDPTDSTTAANMNENNTNATSAAISNLLNGGSTTTGWSSTAVANVTSDFNSYTAPMINNASKDIPVTSYGPASTNEQAEVGIYYNYCAATVGTYCYEGSSGVDQPNTDIDAPQDLCPANWRMPTGGSNGEYLALYNRYNTTMDATNSASLHYNLSTPLSGYYYDRSAYGRGDWGLWWSSTYSGGYDMYRLFVNSTDVLPDSDNSRLNGDSMRCLVGE